MNCRSLNDKKRHNLKFRLNDHQSDIECLTETWFTDVREQKTQFPRYKVFSSKRQNRVGGRVAILDNFQIQATVKALETICIMVYDRTPR